MRRESRKGRPAVSGRQRERHGVGVRMMSAMLRRHSGISAAPTAGLRSATSRVTSRSAHGFIPAQHRAARCTMHAMRYTMHTLAQAPRYRRPRFLFDLHWRAGPESRKKTRGPRSPDRNDPRRRSAIVAGPVPLCGRKIYIQFIFKMKGVTAS